MKVSLSASWLKRTIVIALVASMCIAVFVGIASPMRMRVVRVGALLPLTGDLALIGEASKAAIDLAVEEVNELLGEAGAHWKLKILFRDTQGDPDVALMKLKRLFRYRRVRFVIGPMLSVEVRNIKDYADAKEILVVSPSSTASWLAIPGDFIFRFCPQEPSEGRAIATVMIDEIDTVIAVYPDWGTGLLEAVETRFESEPGNQLDKIWYDHETVVFSELATELDTKVGDVGAEGVFFIGGSHEAVGLFEEIEADTYTNLENVKWYGTESTAKEEPLIENPDVAQFCFETRFISTLFSPPSSYKYDRVHDELENLLGREPRYYAYVAYDIVWALTYSLSMVNRYDSVAVREVLPEVTESLFGASGWIVLNEAGDRAFADYDLWIIEEVDTGVYEWVRVGKYLYYFDSIRWFS